MFSISKAFRVLSLVLAAVLVPATALAGTTGYTAAAKQGQGQAQQARKALKLKSKNKVKAVKPNKDKADKGGQAQKPQGKKKVIRRKH
jgi:hypothetical protein